MTPLVSVLSIQYNAAGLIISRQKYRPGMFV